MRIWREFSFEAAHWLPNVPEDHKCHRMHGHSYRVRVEVEGHILDDGMVLDYGEIKEAWAPLHDSLDHHCLNDVIDNPTSENLARWIFSNIDMNGVASVTVMETATTGAQYP